MSWNHVLDVKNIKIWTDYSDSTQGHLFVNDNHQLKLNVGISFTLDTGETEGPTEDEVHSALSLINNQDSGPLKYLSIVEAGRYTSVYDPNHVSIDPQNDIDDGIYDFVFTYYVSSPSNLNAETHSESVALRVEYPQTNADGTTTVVVKETSAKGNYYTKTYVTVLCYAPMLYGNSGENRKVISLGHKTVADSDCFDVEGHFNHSGDNFKVYWLYIDDPYFKIFYFDGCNEPDENIVHDAFYILKEYSKPRWDHIFNSFFPAIKCGELTYDVKIAVRSDPNHAYDVIVTENITVHQEENQITFLTGFSSAEALREATDVNKYVYVRLYDQFGNNSYIVVGTTYYYSSSSDNGYIKLESVS